MPVYSKKVFHFVRSALESGKSYSLANLYKAYNRRFPNIKYQSFLRYCRVLKQKKLIVFDKKIAQRDNTFKVKHYYKLNPQLKALHHWKQKKKVVAE